MRATLEFLEATPHRRPYHWVKGEMPPGKEKFPVVNVSWDDAVAFCAWDGSGCPRRRNGSAPAAGWRKRKVSVG